MEAVREKWTDDRLDDLSQRVDRGFSDVDRRFDEVDRRFDRLERRFEGLEGRFDRMQWGMITGFLSLGGMILALGASALLSQS